MGANTKFEFERNYNALSDRYCRLLLLTGDSPEKSDFIRACLENYQFESVLLGKELSRLLLDLSPKQRPVRIADYFNDFLTGTSNIFLTDIEILFDRELSTDPITLMKAAARTRNFIVNWPGRFDFATKTLVYAANSHQEHYEIVLNNDILCFDETGNSSLNNIQAEGMR